MRYDVTYRCRFAYDAPAAESHNELRACPSSDEHQHVVHARVATSPSARVLTTTDYWGTRVDAFGVRGQHLGLVVEVEATVDVSTPPPAPHDVGLDGLAEAAFVDEHGEFLPHSAMATPDESVRTLAAEVAAGLGTPGVVEVATALCRAIEDEVDHVTGVTEVGTPIDAVLARGAGVCQDRAHLLVALCRLRGIPARYVSGYLCDGLTGQDTTTHAWVEVAVPGRGWHSLDPSDGEAPESQRIVIGRGRDYADVPPLRGTYVGGDARTLEVAVALSPVTPVS